MKTKIQNIKKQTVVKLLILSLITFLFSCSSTKTIPDGQYLLRRNKTVIISKNNDIDKEILEEYIKQTPNTRVLGIFPFYLHMYNMLNKGKEREWKNKLKKVIGEEPVIYDKYLTDKSKKQLALYLKNKGFYNAIISDTVKNINGKAFVTYFINPNEPYRINTINYSIPDSFIRTILLNDSAKNTLLTTGKLFDVDILNAERVRITKLLHNKSYYNFSKEYIDYLIDSTLNSKQVNINMRIKLVSSIDKNQNRVFTNHKKYITRKIFVYLDMGHRQLNADSLMTNNGYDTLLYHGLTFIYKNKMPITPDVIAHQIVFKPNEFYSSKKESLCYKYLAGLRQFKFIDIQFNEIEEINKNSTDTFHSLDCHIRLVRHTSKSYQVEFEGTNSSTHWGVGENVRFNHKNLFGGAQIFSLKLSGALEVQHDIIGESNSDNFLPNTLELGLETSVKIPKFWTPLNTGRILKKYHPGTTISLLYNYQDRPDYTRTLINAGYGYHWKSSKNKNHLFNPLDLNIINLKDTTPQFSQYFDTLFLKHSYESQFISSSSYLYEFSNQDKKKIRNFSYLRVRTEIAGNFINGMNMLLGTPKNEDDYYDLFNTRYAQYVRADIDMRYYQYINKTSLLVYRSFFGIGNPYGNSEVLPFVKKYFAGGSNGIRAWQVRSLGPGSFVDNSNFPDLAADIKFETNLEYRFDIIWKLKGAFFIDAGNIWAINKYDDREGAMFKFNSFYKEIAIGTGFGARFDFDFILFRIDLGIKARDPELPIGERFIWANRRLNGGDYSWNIGIGYPF